MPIEFVTLDNQRCPETLNVGRLTVIEGNKKWG